MFFYIALFIVCVILAVAFVYVFRALEHVSRHDTHQVSVQSIRTRHANRPKERRLATTINDTPTPWGWDSATKPDQAAPIHPAAPSVNVQAPWGWRGNHNGVQANAGGKGGGGSFPNHYDHVAKPSKIVSPTVGWPYREEKFEFAGKSYKVARRMTPKPTDLSKTSKPWGW